VHFKPPAEIAPKDQVVWVKLEFKLPDLAHGGITASATPSPERDREIESLAKKVQADPQDAPSWQALGNLYWEAGKPDYTAQCFEEALQAQPDNAPLKRWLEQYHKLNPPVAGTRE
jgi:tetratricopeptide (TPR) repeat protein